MNGHQVLKICAFSHRSLFYIYHKTIFKNSLKSIYLKPQMFPYCEGTNEKIILLAVGGHFTQPLPSLSSVHSDVTLYEQVATVAVRQDVQQRRLSRPTATRAKRVK